MTDDKLIKEMSKYINSKTGEKGVPIFVTPASTKCNPCYPDCPHRKQCKKD